MKTAVLMSIRDEGRDEFCIEVTEKLIVWFPVVVLNPEFVVCWVSPGKPLHVTSRYSPDPVALAVNINGY